jgi:hypothetical protein
VKVLAENTAAGLRRNYGMCVLLLLFCFMRFGAIQARASWDSARRVVPKPSSSGHSDRLRDVFTDLYERRLKYFLQIARHIQGSKKSKAIPVTGHGGL